MIAEHVDVLIELAANGQPSNVDALLELVASIALRSASALQPAIIW